MQLQNHPGVDPKYAKQVTKKLINKSLHNNLLQHGGDDDELVTAMMKKLPKLRNKGLRYRFSDKPTLDQLKIRKCESPAQLVDGLHELIKDMPVESNDPLDINKWRVIYQGILNPQS